ncbi:MAG: transposase [Desulfovibrionaceae bacterium]|nr:transposase [Desulfovibrionaceae bacterium]
MKDAALALQRYINDISDKPKFRSRKNSKISFYVNYERLKHTVNSFRGEKLGFVKTATALPKIPKGKKYVNPRISFDGKHLYLSVSYEVEPTKVELTGESLGIDLGVKELAVVSNHDASRTKVYKNINKSYKVRRLEKKLERASRKLEANTKSYAKNCRPILKRPLRECRNIQKQHKAIKLLYKKLTDIRNNYLHQTTTEIVKIKLSQIVMEDLNVKGMIKNKHLAESIAKQKLYEFKRQIQYKAEMYGIKFVEVDRFYASSKTCSLCGHIKKDLKLSERTYICPICGAKLDRDLNAAINLANYKKA